MSKNWTPADKEKTEKTSQGRHKAGGHRSKAEGIDSRGSGKAQRAGSVKVSPGGSCKKSVLACLRFTPSTMGKWRKPLQNSAVCPISGCFESLPCPAVVKTKPEGSLLDVGCGGGWFLRDVNKKYPHLKLTGCDLSEPMLVYSKNLLGDNATIVKGDAQNLPFQDNSFDYITSTLAFHHFPEPDKAISEFWRVLKPNGFDGRH